MGLNVNEAHLVLSIGLSVTWPTVLWKPERGYLNQDSTNPAVPKQPPSKLREATDPFGGNTRGTHLAHHKLRFPATKTLMHIDI